jgi:hypothetical protein
VDRINTKKEIIMEHYVKIITDKQEKTKLSESVFPVFESRTTEQDVTVITIPLPRELSEQESNEYAEHLANYLAEEDYEDFDIIIGESEDIIEETYDGDEFYEQYGVMWFNEDDDLDEAEYQGRKVKLGKPMQGDVKKFKVYVRNPKGNVVKVNFGDPNMRIKKNNAARRRSFRARHNCDNPGPRHKARYWSCRKW